jgi:WD40 repeat protein
MFGLTQPKTPTAALPALQGIWKADIEDHVIALAWSPTGKKLAAAAIGGPITIFSDDGSAQLTLPGHRFGTNAVAWSQDGQHFASAGQDGKVILWDIPTRSPKAVLEGGASWVEHLAWNPLGGTQKGTPHLLATAAGKKLKLWNAEGELVREFADHPSTIASLSWKPKSQFLTTAAYSRLAIFTAGSHTPFRQFTWKGSILTLAWSPNCKYIATGDQDATVHFWFEKDGKDLQMWGYPTKVRELSWDATSRYLATGGGAEVTVWDCIRSPEGSTPITLKSHTDIITALRFQHAGPLLASAGQDGRLFIWHPGQHARPLAGVAINSPLTQLAWSPNDAWLAISAENGGVAVLAKPH